MQMRITRFVFLSTFAFSILAFSAAISASGSTSKKAEIAKSILKNPDFESGSVRWKKDAWKPSGVKFKWKKGAGRNRSKCVRITIDKIPNDAFWKQKVRLTAGAWYNLYGWIKGENIIKQEKGNTGANLCVLGTWEHTDDESSLGSFDWRQVVFTFQAAPSGITEVACRLGYWYSTVTGKAWFDDLYLTSDDFAPRYDGKHVYLILEHEDMERITGVNLTRWVEHLDRAYEVYHELVGDVPYGGRKIGIVSIRQYPGGWAVAGNPIKWMQKYIGRGLDGINREDDWSFGILHELGHDFDRAGLKDGEKDRWTWEAEFFANFKLYYVVEKLGARVEQNGKLYQGSDLQKFYEFCYNEALERGEFNFDCQVYRFIEISKEIGWKPFKQTFRAFLKLSRRRVPKTRLEKFNLFIDKLSKFSKTDVRALIPPEEIDWITRELTGK